MHKLAIAFCLVLLSGCGVLVESSAGHPFANTRDGFYGDGPIIHMAVIADYQYTSALTGFCEYRHVSNLLSGWPVNDENESEVNSVGCGFRLRFF